MQRNQRDEEPGCPDRLKSRTNARRHALPAHHGKRRCSLSLTPTLNADAAGGPFEAQSGVHRIREGRKAAATMHIFCDIVDLWI